MLSVFKLENIYQLEEQGSLDFTGFHLDYEERQHTKIHTLPDLIPWSVDPITKALRITLILGIWYDSESAVVEGFG